MTPTSSVRPMSTDARCSGGVPARASATISAIEPVTATVMSLDPVVSDATGVPTTREYRP